MDLLLEASLMQCGIMLALLKRADERVQVDSVDEFVQTALIHLYFKWNSGLWEVGILGSEEMEWQVLRVLKS